MAKYYYHQNGLIVVVVEGKTIILRGHSKEFGPLSIIHYPAGYVFDSFDLAGMVEIDQLDAFKLLQK